MVSINALQVTERRLRHPFFDEDFFNFFFGNQGTQGLSRPQVEKSLGSGVIIDPSGIIVTCHHVIHNADTIEVKLDDNRVFAAEVVLTDMRNDLAVIKVKNEKADPLNLPYIPLGGGKDIEVGDLVLAIGNPFGVGQTVTNGIVSALARGVNGQILMQTDAPINPGNSGGALIDMKGHLVAIPNAIFSKTGASHGIGFAIPVVLVKPLLTAAKGNGKVAYPWDGITVKSMTPEEAESFGFDRPFGVLVTSTHPLSPALKAGVKAGDIITAVNGTEIQSMEDYLVSLQGMELDKDITLRILRKEKEETLTFKLIPPPESDDPEIKTLTDVGPFAGVKVANLSPAIIEKYNLPEINYEGVIVVEVASISGFGFALIGIQPGNIIEEVNGQKVISVKQLGDLMKKPLRLLSIRRGNIVIKMQLQP